MPDDTGRQDDDAGIKLLQRMENQYATLPVIVLTVRDEPEASHACEQYRNFRAYLVKDPNPVHLKELIQKLLSL
jgi:CheY-like chemotaxis protein